MDIYFDNVLKYDINDTDIEILEGLRYLVNPEVTNIIKDFTVEDYHALPITISEMINPYYLPIQFSNIERYEALKPLYIDTD